MAYTPPVWIKAKPHAGAEKQVGDSDPSARIDVINRVEKGYYAAFQRLLTTLGFTTQDFTDQATVTSYNAANTINFTVGTASLDVAAGAAVNIDAELHVTAATHLDEAVAMSSKAPLVSPAFTTPNIGAATGTSLAVTGTAGINAVFTQNATSISNIGSIGPNIAMLTGTGMTFTLDSPAKLFTLSLATGQSCLVSGSYKSATLALVTNPDGTGVFDLTAAPGANVIGISKGANSDVITLANGAGGATKTIAITVIGSNVTAVTAPA